MALCKWNGGACERETNHPSGICDMHRKMTPTVEDTLAAGVIGNEHYALMTDGEVFLIDAEGHRHKVPESLAEKVRDRINAGKSAASIGKENWDKIPSLPPYGRGQKPR